MWNKIIANKKRIVIVSGVTLTLVLVSIIVSLNGINAAPNSGVVYDDPHIGAMHPHIVSEGPGECSECGMSLSKLDGHTPGTPLPALEDIYTSPDSPMYLHEGAGKDPNSGSTLIPITESSIYSPPKAATHNAPEMAEEHAHQADEIGLYTCGMHPNVIQEGPGICPICNMDLTPMRSKGRRTSSGERKIAYWVAPMDPNFTSDKPGKSPMGMDLVPVYESGSGGGIISIDPTTVQNIGVTTAIVERRDLTVDLRTNGTVVIAEDAEYRINPKISGWIDKLHVARTGDQVEVGDPLLDIYSPELVSAQEEYLLALNSAKMLSKSGIQRVSEGADKLLSAARRRLELWDISSEQIDEIERSGEVKRTMTLYSPVRGVVMHKNAVEGAAMKAGQDLFKIVDLSTIWVEAQVYEHEQSWVKRGNTVNIKSPYDRSLDVSGKVDFIYPYLDQRTRTVGIRIVVRNPRLQLKPDMYVDVRINTQPQKDVVAVPKRAVIRSGKRDIVFEALGEGRFLPHEVKLGIETDDYFAIEAGLTAGIEVVTSAQFLLDSEAKLQESIQRRLDAIAAGRK